jgi:hypothetical protein
MASMLVKVRPLISRSFVDGFADAASGVAKVATSAITVVIRATFMRDSFRWAFTPHRSEAMLAHASERGVSKPLRLIARDTTAVLVLPLEAFANPALADEPAAIAEPAAVPRTRRRSFFLT